MLAERRIVGKELHALPACIRKDGGVKRLHQILPVGWPRALNRRPHKSTRVENCHGAASGGGSRSLQRSASPWYRW